MAAARSGSTGFAAYLRRRVGIMLFLGFSSGLPLALTSGTLQAWLAGTGMDIRLIGLFTLAGLPYALKFLWAPLMDRFVPPWSGRRRGWALICQGALAAAILAMALVVPADAPWLIGALALLVALLSASQDIVLDAYRADLLRGQERGPGAGLFVSGYRLAMLVSGGLALVLADRIGWPATYMLMAAIMAASMVFTLLGPEPDATAAAPATLREAYAAPLRELAGRPAVPAMLALVVCYKLGDAYAGSLTTAFLIGGVGFSATEVGAISKGAGLAALLAGALAGGALMGRLGLYRALLYFGLLQAVTNLGFLALAWAGKHHAIMVSAILLENLAGGMGTAAFVALLMALCDHRYTAAQYALLSAFAAIGRVLLGPTSGFVVAGIGWAGFFAVTMLVAAPGVLLVAGLRARLDRLDAAR